MWKVYRAHFSSDGNTVLHAILVVDPRKLEQGVGRLYRLKGHFTVELDPEIINQYVFSKSRSLMSKAPLFEVPEKFLTEFDGIAKQTPIEYDPDTQVRPHTLLEIYLLPGSKLLWRLFARSFEDESFCRRRDEDAKSHLNLPFFTRTLTLYLTSLSLPGRPSGVSLSHSPKRFANRGQASSSVQHKCIPNRPDTTPPIPNQ